MLTKLRLAALGLAAAAVLIAPASAFADEPEPEGTPAPWTYNPGDQLQPTQGFKWTVKFNLCQVIDC